MNTNGSAVSPPSRTRYGIANPERVENSLWEMAIRERWSGYRLRQHLGAGIAKQSFHQDFSLSPYRDTSPGPSWSWERFGRTSTPLPDGRVIHIAGEHEDSYDPDFCIYNDVVVEHPDGRLDIFLYPGDVFPPTDFHTATLIGGDIILIGSLGYRDLRRPGETQLLRLDTRTLRIEPIEAKGEAPGWIYRHIAEMLNETSILVTGGMVQTAGSNGQNPGVFELDLATMSWRRREHGDMSVFPVSEAVYRQHKSPRYGNANPERSDNIFWLEMARRKWPPSRARLHFGDLAPRRPELVLTSDEAEPGAEPPGSPSWYARLDADLARSKLVRVREDVVWTAVREEPLTLTLPDGSALTIGGQILDYGDEYADPWTYNDIIVTHPGGEIEILMYPKEVFPHVSWPTGAFAGGGVYIFGRIDEKLHPRRSGDVAALRLDISTWEITDLPIVPPSAPVRLEFGPSRAEGTSLIFPVTRQNNFDPPMDIAFDVDTLAWGEPFAPR